MADLNTTSTLSPEIMTYYEKVFLARSEYEFVLEQGAQKKTHSQNSGRTINFTRYQPLTITTTPLGEGCNPSLSNINACTVAVTLSEYGNSTQHSKLLTLTSIDDNMKEKVELIGQQMGETLNRLVRTLSLDSGSSYFPNGHTSANVAAGDTLSASAIRGMVKNLELNYASPYEDGMFLGKTNPYSKYSLIGDTTWVSAKTYVDTKDLYKGEMGELYQVRWLLNKDALCEAGDASTAACAVANYSTYVHGRDAFGCMRLDGDMPKLFIIPSTQIDSANPAGRRTMISWAGTYAAVLLNSSWLVRGRFTAS
jgi:N4-gp56 family major capsid protein